MIKDPYNRPTSNIVTYPVKFVRGVNLSRLISYNTAMSKTLDYIKRPILATECKNDTIFSYHDTDFPNVINELRKTFIAGLFHFWFQELQAFLIEGGDTINERKKEIEKMGANRILDLLTIDETLSKVFPIIKKYALLTNAIKHGSGNSLTKLRKKHKEFFYPSEEYTITDEEGFISENATEPLVTQQHIEELFNNLILFWQHLPQDLVIDFNKIAQEQ